jgi:hypothetical protein
MKRGIFNHHEAFDERPQGWPGNLLKNLHHAALVRTPPKLVIAVRDETRELAMA